MYARIVWTRASATEQETERVAHATAQVVIV
jgi:hypothetical protein